MRGNTEHGTATAVRAVNNKAKQERRRRRIRSRRMHMLALTSAGLIVILLAVSTVFYSVKKTELSDVVEQKKAELAQLDSECIALTAKKENSIDLSYVEDYAENVLGLVKQDPSQEEYLELQKTDQVEVNEASSGVDKLVSSFVKSFNAILSFLR